MSWLTRFLLWSSIVGVCLLPALSNAGYYPIDRVYMILALFSFMIGAACTLIDRFHNIRLLTLIIFFVFSSSLYYGRYLFQTDNSLLISAAILNLLIIFAIYRFEKAHILCGVMAFSQICFAAIATPYYIEFLKEFPVKRSDAPSVIHLMMDEHAGIAPLASTTIPKEKVDAFRDAYVKRGFIVFTHAYTADMYTQNSMVRMLNADQKRPSKFVSTNTEGRYHHTISHASSFDRIMQNRVLDLTETQYLKLRGSIENAPSIARIMGYEELVVRDALQKGNNISLQQQMLIARNNVFLRLKGIRSPVLKWLSDSTIVGQKFVRKVSNQKSSNPIVARYVLQNLGLRLANSGERGTYYFAHLLLPHFPFVFNEKCELYPTHQWRLTKALGKNPAAVQKDREYLYSRHFEQATCAATEIFALDDAIKERKELSDAVILVHSDHGARISSFDMEAIESSKEMKEEYQRDVYGSFIAIKIPGMEGRIIDTPVRLDKFYDNLLKNNFKTLDFDQLIPTKGSPYKWSGAPSEDEAPK